MNKCRAIDFNYLYDGNRPSVRLRITFLKGKDYFFESRTHLLVPHTYYDVRTALDLHHINTHECFEHYFPELKLFKI